MPDKLLSPSPSQKLPKTLGPLMLWGLGVGYVISGMYFGWNLGLAEGGVAGLAVATFFVVIMYITFTLGYAELAIAMPRAGGAFFYAQVALGPRLGRLTGSAQLIEFLFAPPAISMAIGAYAHLFYPALPPLFFAVAAYLLFTGLNIWGVKAAARFELFVTILAVGELLLFSGLTLPHFSWEKFSSNPLPHSYSGVFAAIPFAIWFFLAIEGLANVAEEAKNPQRSLVIGLGSAMATLVFLCILTFVSSVGIGGWEKIVFSVPGAPPSDSPLPLALGQLIGQNHLLYHMLVTVGIFGLVASFHGIILAAGRVTLEMGRAGLLPKTLSQIHPKTKTPGHALVFNFFVGLAALLSGETAGLIIISVFGALTLYILSTLSLFALRAKAPDLPRPFRTPLYPYVPMMALLLSSVCLITMCIYHFKLACLFALLLLAGQIWYSIVSQKKLKVEKNLQT